MAEFDRIPREPVQELLITIAGPAVNFTIAAGLLPFAWSGLLSADDLPAYSPGALVDQLCAWNFIMGCFNLLPVFPMDGGRIFRALLAFKLPYLRATWWAVTVGKILALGFAVTAFYLQWQLTAVLFLFIFWAGDSEYKQLLRREQEALYWAEMARRIVPTAPPPDGDQPPLLPSYHGPN